MQNTTTNNQHDTTKIKPLCELCNINDGMPFAFFSMGMELDLVICQPCLFARCETMKQQYVYEAKQ